MFCRLVREIGGASTVLLKNESPTAPFKHKAPRSDWVVHAHFGDFEPGVVELPSSPHNGVCIPGTVTAVMARYIHHGFPPVAGERFILTQVYSSAMVYKAGCQALPVEASSTAAVTCAAATKDQEMETLLEVDHFVYKWQERQLPVQRCSCCH